MNWKQWVPRVILWIMSGYHIVVGIALNCPAEWVKWVALHWFSISQLPPEPSIHIARMLGVYMVAFGIALGTAAWNPVKNRAMLTIGVILAITRCLQRLITAAQLESTLGISRWQNLTLVAPLALFTIVLVVFRIQIYRQMHREPTNLAL